MSQKGSSVSQNKQIIESNKLQENTDGEYVVAVQFAAKLKSNSWNRWDKNERNKGKAYGILNKPGGLGIDKDRPKIYNEFVDNKVTNSNIIDNSVLTDNSVKIINDITVVNINNIEKK